MKYANMTRVKKQIIAEMKFANTNKMISTKIDIAKSTLMIVLLVISRIRASFSILEV